MLLADFTPTRLAVMCINLYAIYGVRHEGAYEIVFLCSTCAQDGYRAT